MLTHANRSNHFKDSPFYKNVVAELLSFLQQSINKYGMMPRDRKAIKTHRVMHHLLKIVADFSDDFLEVIAKFDKQNEPFLISFLFIVKRIYNKTKAIEDTVVDSLEKALGINSYLVKNKLAQNKIYKGEAVDTHDAHYDIALLQACDLPADIKLALLKVRPHNKSAVAGARDLLFGHAPNLHESERKASLILQNKLFVLNHIISKFSEHELRHFLREVHLLSRDLIIRWADTTKNLPHKTHELMPFLNPAALTFTFFGSGIKLDRKKPPHEFHYIIKEPERPIQQFCLDDELELKLSTLPDNIKSALLTIYRYLAFTTEEQNPTFELVRKLEGEVDRLNDDINDFTWEMDELKSVNQFFYQHELPADLDKETKDTIVANHTSSPQKYKQDLINIFAKKITLDQKIAAADTEYLNHYRQLSSEQKDEPEEKSTHIQPAAIYLYYSHLIRGLVRKLSQIDSELNDIYHVWVKNEVNRFRRQEVELYQSQHAHIIKSKNSDEKKIKKLQALLKRIHDDVDQLQYPLRRVSFDYTFSHITPKELIILLCIGPIITSISKDIVKLQESSVTLGNETPQEALPVDLTITVSNEAEYKPTLAASRTYFEIPPQSLEIKPELSNPPPPKRWRTGFAAGLTLVGSCLLLTGLFAGVGLALVVVGGVAAGAGLSLMVRDVWDRCRDGSDRAEVARRSSVVRTWAGLQVSGSVELSREQDNNAVNLPSSRNSDNGDTATLFPSPAHANGQKTCFKHGRGPG